MWLLVPGVCAVVLAGVGVAAAGGRIAPGGGSGQRNDCTVTDNGTVTSDITGSPGASIGTASSTRCGNTALNTGHMHGSHLGQDNDCATTNTGTFEPFIRDSGGVTADTAFSSRCGNTLANTGHLSGSHVAQGNDCATTNTGDIRPVAVGSNVQGASERLDMSTGCGNALANTGDVHDSHLDQDAGCATTNTAFIQPIYDTTDAQGASADTAFSSRCGNALANTGHVHDSHLGQRDHCATTNTGRLDPAAFFGTAQGASLDNAFSGECGNTALNSGRLNHTHVIQGSDCATTNTGSISEINEDSPGASTNGAFSSRCGNTLANTGHVHDSHVTQGNDCATTNTGDIDPQITDSAGASADTALSNRCRNTVVNLGDPHARHPAAAGGVLAPGSRIDQDNRCRTGNTGDIAPLITDSPGATANTDIPTACDNTVVHLGNGHGGSAFARPSRLHQDNGCTNNSSGKHQPPHQRLPRRPRGHHHPGRLPQHHRQQVIWPLAASAPQPTRGGGVGKAARASTSGASSGASAASARARARASSWVGRAASRSSRPAGVTSV